MKLLIIDPEACGLSYALRARDAGHQVRLFIKPSEMAGDTGRGFKGIELIDNWVGSAGWADLIITTFNADYLERLAFLKKKGMPVFAPSPESANLEISREMGMKIMEKAGIETAPFKTFATMAEAEKHVLKTEERFVFKTMGDNEDKSLTYVSKSPADMVAWMRRTPPPKGKVMLQTFIEGIEMGVSRFVGSKGFVGQWNESFEHKKLMPGNHGPNTGEMGTVAYFTKTSKIGDATLGKLEEELVKHGHLGDAALGFMIDDKGKPWPTEWTCRMGWPISNMMLGATKGDPVQWMLDAIHGKDTTTFSEDIGVCIVLAHGTFPHKPLPKDRAKTDGIPIYGVTRGVAAHFHPQYVQVLKLPNMTHDGHVKESATWATAGDYVGVVTGYGKSVSQAAKRAYGTVDKIQLGDVKVRDDIGEGLKEQLPKLHTLGYAVHCRY